jgi:hypothetical protein
MGKGKDKFTHTHIQNPEKNWVQVYDSDQENLSKERECMPIT